jgi:hypothetical protein
MDKWIHGKGVSTLYPHLVHGGLDVDTSNVVVIARISASNLGDKHWHLQCGAAHDVLIQAVRVQRVLHARQESVLGTFLVILEQPKGVHMTGLHGLPRWHRMQSFLRCLTQKAYRRFLGVSCGE